MGFLVCVIAHWPEGWQCPQALFGSITLYELVLSALILLFWQYGRS